MTVADAHLAFGAWGPLIEELEKRGNKWDSAIARLEELNSYGSAIRQWDEWPLFGHLDLGILFIAYLLEQRQVPANARKVFLLTLFSTVVQSRRTLGLAQTEFRAVNFISTATRENLEVGIQLLQTRTYNAAATLLCVGLEGAWRDSCREPNSPLYTEDTLRIEKKANSLKSLLAGWTRKSGSGEQVQVSGVLSDEPVYVRALTQWDRDRDAFRHGEITALPASLQSTLTIILLAEWLSHVRKDTLTEHLTQTMNELLAHIASDDESEKLLEDAVTQVELFLNHIS